MFKSLQRYMPPEAPLLPGPSPLRSLSLAYVATDHRQGRHDRVERWVASCHRAAPSADPNRRLPSEGQPMVRRVAQAMREVLLSSPQIVWSTAIAAVVGGCVGTACWVWRMVAGHYADVSSTESWCRKEKGLFSSCMYGLTTLLGACVGLVDGSCEGLVKTCERAMGNSLPKRSENLWGDGARMLRGAGPRCSSRLV